MAEQVQGESRLIVKNRSRKQEEIYEWVQNHLKA